MIIWEEVAWILVQSGSQWKCSRKSSLMSLIDRLDYFHPNRLSVLSAQTTALLLLQRKGKFSHFVSPLAPTVKISAKYSPHSVGYCWILSTCQRRIENIPSQKRSEQQPDSCETDNATLSAPFDSLHRILANIIFRFNPLRCIPLEFWGAVAQKQRCSQIFERRQQQQQQQH